MKIINNTHWKTSDLRRIAARAAREEFPKDRFPNHRIRFGFKHLRLIIGYNRGSSNASSGHARYNQSTAHVNIPSWDVDPVDFAHVVAHEFGHCKGLEHKDMPPHMVSTTVSGRSDYIRNHFAWAKAIPIRHRAEKPKLKPTVEAKLRHAEVMLAMAVTRRKRAATIEAKWRKTKRYYERKLTAGLPVAALSAEPTTAGPA